MRVLILTQYFSPEIGATQTRLHAFAAGLTERGHDVEVICEVPNHPHGVVRAGYGGRLVDRRQLDGFRVNYVWVRTSPAKTTRTRLAFYGSYMASAAVVGAALERPDVIFASSPPLPVALAGAAVAARHRVPWVLDVRDLWPDAAVALGELSNPRALRLARRLERFLYRNARAVTVVTGSFRDAVVRRGGADGSIHVVGNGASEIYVRAAESDPDRVALGLPPDKFVWIHAGNVGEAQGLDAAVDAAAELGDEFRFVVLGDGPARTRLEHRAAGRAPGTVVFRDQVPQEEAAKYLRASDALLVSLAPEPVFESFVPSKLYDCCAVGRPVVLAAAGESRSVVGTREAALAVPPGEPQALADALRRLRADGALALRLSTAGRRFGREHQRAEQVEELERLLEHVVSESVGGR